MLAHQTPTFTFSDSPNPSLQRTEEGVLATAYATVSGPPRAHVMHELIGMNGGLVSRDYVSGVSAGLVIMTLSF